MSALSATRYSKVGRLLMAWCTTSVHKQVDDVHGRQVVSADT